MSSTQQSWKRSTPIEFKKEIEGPIVYDGYEVRTYQDLLDVFEMEEVDVEGDGKAAREVFPELKDIPFDKNFK